MGGDEALRRGQQSMQGDVLIPDIGAGPYWYVDPSAGVAQQPAQAQQVFAPTQPASNPIADVFSRMFGPDQSDLTYRPSSARPYDPMAQVRQDAQQTKEMESMFHRTGPEDVYKTVTMDLGNKKSGSQEWEVPAVFDNMTEDERNIITYLPHTQWPDSIKMKIETNARDNLEQGNDPYGNPLPAGVAQRMGF
jgi:hypothetical protein